MRAALLLVLVALAGCIDGHPSSAYHVWFTCVPGEPSGFALARDAVTDAAAKALDVCAAEGKSSLDGAREVSAFSQATEGYGQRARWGNATATWMVVVP